MLERGKDVEHRKDYQNARKAPWEYPHRGGRTREMVEAYPVLQRDYPLNEKNLDWWVIEQDSPYTEVKRFDWYRGYHVGGRSLTWGRQSYRLSDFDFEANSRTASRSTGRSGYADLAPWYDHVERHAGISGIELKDSAAARRSIPAGDAAQLSRGGDRRPHREAVRASAVSSPAASPTSRARCRDAFPASTETPARWDVRPVPTSARRPHAAGSQGDREAHAEGRSRSSPTSSTTRVASAPPACA
jgi:choline dehydrogenase-like flavoprotein